MMKKLYKDYNKRITNRGKGNVQSHDQEENKLNCTINANSGAHSHKKIPILTDVYPIQLTDN